MQDKADLHPGAILVVDDNFGVLAAAKLFLKRHFSQVDTERNPENLPNLLSNMRYDVILLDMNFTKDRSSGKEGFFWLERILQIDASAVVILITAYGDVEMAVQAIKGGATDFVLKPWENEKLLATLLSAMKLRASKVENDELKAKQKGLAIAHNEAIPEILGNSPAMRKVFETINRVAQTDANVIILGENGTGKELVAQAIHQQSRRSNEHFVKVDLGAITETLFESELFGHVKGAFTDARDDRPGRFEAANRGTIFLDEIGNLSAGLQAKLLSALQNRVITRVGSNQARPIDVRVISATNMPLYEMVKERSFRQDLLYRINTIEIHLPALRERADDILLLAEHFLQLYNRKYNRHISSISTTLKKALQAYPWPGNVRELQHAMERAVIMATDHGALQPDDFMLGASPALEADSLNLSSMNLEDIERETILKAIKKHQGNISEASKELGLTRASLYRRLEKYGI
jgi:DNA-binding NtrC family response regulator